MNVRMLSGALAAITLAVSSLCSPAGAVDDVQLPAILSLTGSASFIGRGQMESLVAIEKNVNAHGGIRGSRIHFAIQDDQSSPQVGVQLLNGLIAGKAPVIFGPTFAAVCSAAAAIVRDTGPVIYCFAPGIHPVPGSYVFSASVGGGDMAASIVRWARLKGWKRVAIISSTDASGQDFEHGFDAAMGDPKNAVMQLATREHFGTTDISIDAQMTRIKAAAPQLLIAWTAGTGFGTVLRSVKNIGVEIPIVGGNGNMVPQQLEQYAAFMPKELYFPGGRGMSTEGTLPGPVRDAQMEYFNAMNGMGVKISFPNYTSWDATHLILAAYRDLGFRATAQQIRDNIVARRGWIGISGVYDFRDSEQRGVGQMSCVIDRYDASHQTFVPASRPAGYL